MSARVRMTFIALVLLSVTPGLALAGVCYDLAGLPEAASLNLTVGAATSQGPIPLVGEAQGVCGLGQPSAALQGNGIVEQNGAVRVGVKLLAARAGCSGAEGELILTPPFTTGSGQLRWPEGSVANVTLTLDGTGQACQPRTPRPAACVSNDTTLCLLQNRFRVTATIATGPQTLQGQAGKNGSESGFFSLFGTTNVELVVKVLDDRALNTFFWVVVTPVVSNVGYTLTVTDTQNGRVKTYTSPVTAAPPPVFDTGAFSAIP
jgi:hypothetical protein